MSKKMKQTNERAKHTHKWRTVAAVNKGQLPIRQECRCGAYRQRRWNYFDLIGYTATEWEAQP